MADWLSTDAQQRITAAIAAAEARTAGEIVCTCSLDRHVYLEWILPLATAVALLLPLLLTWFGFGPSSWLALLPALASNPPTERDIIQIYALAQIITLLIATPLLWLSPLAQRLAPLALRRSHVHELALRQFLGRGIHLTTARTGVLIHLSLHDHVAEVIADAKIYAKVPPEHWGETLDALLSGAAANDPAQGFVDAIALAGTVLAEHFPPAADNPDELPNHLIIT